MDLSRLARQVADEIQNREPDRTVDVLIQDGLVADADIGLMKIVVENLLENAWKFTRKVHDAKIAFGVIRAPDSQAYFVKDNGAGFDMSQAERLFRPFQRLHSETEFSGTGIGLATVQRAIDRHGGRVWAEGGVGRGATLFFTIGKATFGYLAGVAPT